MSESALQRTVRRAAAVVVLSVATLTFALLKWMRYDSGVEFGAVNAVVWTLALGAAGYLAVSALLQGLASTR